MTRTLGRHATANRRRCVGPGLSLVVRTSSERLLSGFLVQLCRCMLLQGLGLLLTEIVTG